MDEDALVDRAGEPIVWSCSCDGERRCEHPRCEMEQALYEASWVGKRVGR